MSVCNFITPLSITSSAEQIVLWCVALFFQPPSKGIYANSILDAFSKIKDDDNDDDDDCNGDDMAKAMTTNIKKMIRMVWMIRMLYLFL